MINLAVWFVAGALVGACAGMLMRDEDDRGVFLNVVAGIVGALAAAWLFAPHVGLERGDPKVFNFGDVSAALLGAIASLGLMSLFPREER